VGRNNVINGLMENTASMEIRKKRGFPPPLLERCQVRITLIPAFALEPDFQRGRISVILT
jgi:hypothetical protein